MAVQRNGYRRGKREKFRECVCVFFPFILDIKFVGRTSRGHTVSTNDINRLDRYSPSVEKERAIIARDATKFSGADEQDLATNISADPQSAWCNDDTIHAYSCISCKPGTAVMARNFKIAYDAPGDALTGRATGTREEPHK